VKRLDVYDGQRFERLTVVGCSYTNGVRKINVICDCGSNKSVAASSLVHGVVKSCGCLQKDLLTTHGMSRSPEYIVWQQMKRRCYSAKHPRYKDWGGRGITVCDEWRNSFVNFLNSVGKRPTNRHSIERLNNNGNYEPGNVTWATPKEQANNRRSKTSHLLHTEGV
jgi:hypothetical protein